MGRESGEMSECVKPVVCVSVTGRLQLAVLSWLRLQEEQDWKGSARGHYETTERCHTNAVGYMSREFRGGVWAGDKFKSHLCETG